MGTDTSTHASAPPRKRPRESEEVTRHEQLWFEDGNIVLVAEMTAFRVHRSLLSRHSVVFKDLFELSQPSNAEQLEGVPRCTVHDSPHELEDLLNAIYHGIRFWKPDTKSSYVVLQSLIQLGAKYEIQEFHEEALKCLKLLFPDNYDDWKKMRKIGPPVTYEDADVISMVNLIKDEGLPVRYLNLALYRCCYHLSAESVVRGIPHSRGYTARLASDSLVNYVQAKTKFAELALAATSEQLRPEAEPSNKDCLHELLVLYSSGPHVLPLSIDLLHSSIPCIEHVISAVKKHADWIEANLCQKCRRNLMLRVIDTRRLYYGMVNDCTL